VHYLTPTTDNEKQTEAMQTMGIFKFVNNSIGEIIIAGTDMSALQNYTNDQGEIEQLIGINKLATA
jgi:hypothetical protein